MESNRKPQHSSDGQEGTEARQSNKRAYEAPRIVSSSLLEAMATVCTPGKATPAACPLGPISS